MSSTLSIGSENAEEQLSPELVTPSETTNRLILLCFKVYYRQADPRALGLVLDECARELLEARDAFYRQVNEEGLTELIPNSIKDVMNAFQQYTQALTYAKSWFKTPEQFPLEQAPYLLRDAYSELYEALMAYEWDYLSQGEEPHPALNLMQKVIDATKEGVISDDRLNEILDRLWEHFSQGMKTFEEDLDLVRGKHGQNAISEVLAGIQIIDEYFDEYNPDRLDDGYVRLRKGCLLLVELLQESTGEALADAPTPSPQVNWVIHSARAVLDGLGSDLLERAQAWFEPQLAESYFRFEQCAQKALEGPARMAEQVPIARDGFDRLNRSLPLLRLGIERRALLHKAIQHLEDGADLIHQAWEIFVDFEEKQSQVQCIRCGHFDPAESRVCSACGAKIVRTDDTPELSQPKAQVATDSNEQPDTSDHLARLIEACDSAKFGRMSKIDFDNCVAWGRQLLRSATANVARLPESGPDPLVNKAIQTLKTGVEEFQQGLDEMQWYSDTGAPAHLSLASSILVQAYTHFNEVQAMASGN